MRRLVPGLLFLTACGAEPGGDRYGFVTMLGRDTISVESVSRRGDTLSIDGVDRFPRVRLRHTDVVLAADRSFQRMSMDIRTPSASIEKDRDRAFTADFGRDSLRVTVRDGSGTHVNAYKNGEAIVLPHVSQSYSLAELYIDAALARAKAAKLPPGDSVTVSQFYPDFDLEGFPYRGGFVFHDGWVEPLPGNRVELWHGMISGVGFATVDSAGRLLKYDGSQSTYKVDVRRVDAMPDVKTIGAAFVAAEKASGAKQLSVRDTARASIGAATFSVDYGRPLARGRRLVGDVIEVDQVWRTGANAATQFSTSAPITLAGLVMMPGMYTLWTVPHAQGVDLVVSRQTGQWGTDYDPAHDLGRAAIESRAAADTVEKFTIAVTQSDAHHGALLMSWGTFRWSAPIVVR
jgi:hypothetical protein